MEGLLYPLSLVLLVLAAFGFYQSNSTKLALLMVIIGVYIVYSNETGNTLTDFKDGVVNSIDKSADEFSESHKTKEYD